MTDSNKCRDCKWLSEEKCSIGRKCVNPDKEWRSYTAQWKSPSGKACKLFDKSDVKVQVEDEYIKVNKNKLLIMLQNMYDPVKARSTYNYLLK